MQRVSGGGFEAPPAQRGDCFRACVASILEIAPEDLPNPHDEQHWGKAWIRELAQFGIEPVFLVDGFEGPVFPGYWIASIPSPAIDGDHCVVMRGLDLVHDPFPGSTRETVDLETVKQAVLFLPYDVAGAVLKPEEAATYDPPGARV
jgi:hypothetical protein